ncbi:MAG: four helix bundle protein [Gemmatimonadaceae bacterium]|nr:four helix bundle protein [Gemmatimonadaceae bacterium]
MGRGTGGTGGALDRVQAYTIARRLAGEAWGDTQFMIGDPRLTEVASQLIRAIGSIGAQIAEGYSRRSRADRIRYYEYALGSTEEAVTWYETARPVLSAAVLEARLADLVSIRRLLLTMIRNERAARSSVRSPPSAEDNARRGK